MTKKNNNCLDCGKIIWSNRIRCKHCSNINRNFRSENHPMWKGDNTSYRSLHYWIQRYKPKSICCEKCGKLTDKLDCANISGNYKRDINDFKWLCRKCHLEEDGRMKNNLKQYRNLK